MYRKGAPDITQSCDSQRSPMNRRSPAAREQSIFAAAPDGSTLYVDVKTLRPEDGDRWEQFEEAVREDWVPENVNVVLSRSYGR